MAWLNRTNMIDFYLNASATTKFAPNGKRLNESPIKNCFYGSQAVKPCPPSIVVETMFGICHTLLANNTSSHTIRRAGPTNDFRQEKEKISGRKLLYIESSNSNAISCLVLNPKVIDLNLCFRFEYDIHQEDYSTQTASLGAGIRVRQHLELLANCLIFKRLVYK